MRIGDRIQLSVFDALGTNLTAVAGVPDTHFVLPNYRWFSTPNFTNPVSGTLCLVAADPQWAEGSFISIDRAFVVAITNISPMLTDPLDSDTDATESPIGEEQGIKDKSLGFSLSARSMHTGSKRRLLPARADRGLSVGGEWQKRSSRSRQMDSFAALWRQIFR